MSHNRPAKTSSKGGERSKSQLESYGGGIDLALQSLRAARKLVVDALTFIGPGEDRVSTNAMIESQRTYEQAMNESQRKYDEAWIEFQRNRDRARIEFQRNRDKAWTDLQRNRDKEWIDSQRKCDKEWIESNQNHNKEWMESQQNYDKEWIESLRNYEQVSEQSKKSIQDPRNKPAQQPRQLSQSYHQTPPQYKQRLEKLDDKSSYPLLSKDAGAVPRSLPESVGGGSREDGDKTSVDHGRERKRVKCDDIKKEPVDGTTSDAATASTSSSTTTSTASTTSTFSTSSGHTVADVTLDIENKLNFNPTTAISQ
ncbi:hypothetical protein EC957_005995 [Mortierella hygrophila]|uniref:Uncharacterized protein n=1 Tax=Mortierella hygrophila TaxID=979708 RepID=A0A9P6JYU9_9FUNG|nr:hypothetical protein EC957_005995 [Mortierella hygrophila]